MIVLVNKRKFTTFLAFFLILVLALFGTLNMKNIKQGLYPTKYSSYVEKYSNMYGVDKYLVYSVIKAESNFDETAMSDKGAVGLMQIMPETGEEYAGKIGIEGFSGNMLSEPEVNVQIGCYYLAYLMNRYSNHIPTAAAAYNAGLGNVDDWLAQEQVHTLTVEIVPFGETRKYIEKVEGYYNKYLELYEEE